MNFYGQFNSCIEFIRRFHEFSVTMNYEFFKKISLFIYSLCTANVNNNICRFVDTEFAKLSDEFDIAQLNPFLHRSRDFQVVRSYAFKKHNFC